MVKGSNRGTWNKIYMHIIRVCLYIISSVEFSRSVVSHSLPPHEPQCTRPPCPSPIPGVHPNPCPLSRWCHSTISSSVVHARPPCPSPTSGVYTNSCPLSWWCHPTISSSVVPFSSGPQSFPASGSFQMSQLFVSGGQRIGVSASASVLPMNIQDWFPLGWTRWISLQSKGLSRIFSNTIVQKHPFFGAQLPIHMCIYFLTSPLGSGLFHHETYNRKFYKTRFFFFFAFSNFPLHLSCRILLQKIGFTRIESKWAQQSWLIWLPRIIHPLNLSLSPHTQTHTPSSCVIFVFYWSEFFSISEFCLLSADNLKGNISPIWISFFPPLLSFPSLWLSPLIS